jgi:hypothetical protein
MTPAEVLALPAVVDVPTAGRALGIGETLAYELAKNNEFPCKVLRLGRLYRIPRAGLLEVLGLATPDMDAAALPGAADVTASTAEETDRLDEHRTIRAV